MMNCPMPSAAPGTLKEIKERKETPRIPAKKGVIHETGPKKRAKKTAFAPYLRKNAVPFSSTSRAHPPPLFPRGEKAGAGSRADTEARHVAHDAAGDERERDQPDIQHACPR